MAIVLFLIPAKIKVVREGLSVLSSLVLLYLGFSLFSIKSLTLKQTGWGWVSILTSGFINFQLLFCWL